MTGTDQDRPHPWEGARYARIPWVVMNDPKLSDGDRTTLCQIARYIDVCGEDSAHPSRATLALWGNVTVKAISARIERLVSRGLIEVVKRPGSSHSYRLRPLSDVYTEDEIAQANRLPSLSLAQAATGRNDATRSGKGRPWSEERRQRTHRRNQQTRNLEVTGSSTPHPEPSGYDTRNLQVTTTRNLQVTTPVTFRLPDVIISKEHPRETEEEETTAADAPRTARAGCSGGSPRSVQARDGMSQPPGKIDAKTHEFELHGESSLVVLENTNPRDDKSHPLPPICGAPPSPLRGADEAAWLEAKRQPAPIAPREQRRATTVQLNGVIPGRSASPVDASSRTPLAPAAIEDLEPALALWVKGVLDQDLHINPMPDTSTKEGARAARVRDRALQGAAIRLWNIWEPLLVAAGFPAPARPTKRDVRDLAEFLNSYHPDLVAKMLLALVRHWTKGLREQVSDADTHPHKPIRAWEAPDLLQLATLSSRRRQPIISVVRAVAEGRTPAQAPRILTAAERAHADAFRGESSVPPEEMIGLPEGFRPKKIKKSRLN